jgi:hypothetical protein
MGDEFLVKLGNAGKPSLEKLAHEISVLGSYAPEGNTENSISFRWRGKERRPKWPEDSTISEKDEALMVVVHAGTRLERTTILEDVKSALILSGGTFVSVEEI